MRSAATIAGLLALAASTLADTGFTLHAFSTRSKDLVHWAVVNAHVGAGQNVLTVQRPTAYESDLAVIRGTDRQKRNQKGRLQFVLPGAEIPYEANIPFIPKGTVGSVSVREGEGTHAFALADGVRPTEVDLLVYGDKHGFWVCPEEITDTSGEVFVLYYGRNPRKANLPSPKCQPVRLEAEVV